MTTTTSDHRTDWCGMAMVTGEHYSSIIIVIIEGYTTANSKWVNALHVTHSRMKNKIPIRNSKILEKNMFSKWFFAVSFSLSLSLAANRFFCLFCRCTVALNVSLISSDSSKLRTSQFFKETFCCWCHPTNVYVLHFHRFANILVIVSVRLPLFGWLFCPFCEMIKWYNVTSTFVTKQNEVSIQHTASYERINEWMTHSDISMRFENGKTDERHQPST